MAKKQANSNWGKPLPAIAECVPPTSFEEVVKKLRLCPAQYLNSQTLKDWVQKNMHRKYVPLDLLDAWKLEADVE